MNSNDSSNVVINASNVTNTANVANSANTSYANANANANANGGGNSNGYVYANSNGNEYANMDAESYANANANTYGNASVNTNSYNSSANVNANANANAGANTYANTNVSANAAVNGGTYVSAGNSSQYANGAVNLVNGVAFSNNGAVNRPTSMNAVPRANVGMNIIPQANAPMNTVPRDNASMNSIPRTNAPMNAVPRANAPMNVVPRANAPMNVIPRANAPVNMIPRGNAPVNAVPSAIPVVPSENVTSNVQVLSGPVVQQAAVVSAVAHPTVTPGLAASSVIPVVQDGKEAWINFGSITGTGFVGAVLCFEKSKQVQAASGCSVGGDRSSVDNLPTLVGLVTIEDNRFTPHIFPFADVLEGDKRMFIFPVHGENGGNQFLRSLHFFTLTISSSSSSSGEDKITVVEMQTSNDVDETCMLFYRYRTCFEPLAKDVWFTPSRYPMSKPCDQFGYGRPILQDIAFHVRIPSIGSTKVQLLRPRRRDVKYTPMPIEYPFIVNPEVDGAMIEPEPMLGSSLAPKITEQALFTGGTETVPNPFATQPIVTAVSALPSPSIISEQSVALVSSSVPVVASSCGKTVQINPEPTQVVIFSRDDLPNGAMIEAPEVHPVVPKLDQESLSSACNPALTVSRSRVNNWSCLHFVGAASIITCLMVLGWILSKYYNEATEQRMHNHDNDNVISSSSRSNSESDGGVRNPVSSVGVRDSVSAPTSSTISSSVTPSLTSARTDFSSVPRSSSSILTGGANRRLL